MSGQPWVPECAEDELLVAIVAVKRALQTQSIGVDPGAFPVLHLLAAQGPSRQSTVAEVLGLDASTVSRHVRSLTNEKLVVATRDPDDGRAVRLSLTDKGRDYLTARLRAHREALHEATSSLEPEERTELVRLLHKLAAALAGPKESE